MSKFDKKFGEFTLRKLRSRDVCKADNKEMCRNIVSIYEKKCKKCHEEEKKNEDIT